MKLLWRVRYYYLQLKGLVVFRKRVGILGNFYVGNRRNVTIGDYCGINEGVFILAHNRVDIGSWVVLSARCMLLDAGLRLNDYAHVDFPEHMASFVKVEDGVWVGAGAIILPGVTLGKKSVVGAGSVVTRDVPPFTVVAGNPAKPIGRTDK